MKRSTQIATPLLASAALALLAGCRQPEMQRCVDETNHVVADNLCGQSAQQQRPDGHGGFIFLPSPYRFYYGGMGGYGLGSTVAGGGFGSTLSGGHGEGAGE